MEIILSFFLNIHKYPKNIILVLIVCFSYNEEVFAQEFLKPQEPIQFIPLEILKYEIFVREAFHDAFSDDTLLGVVVMESFEKEYVLYVNKEKKIFLLVF